MAGIWDQYRAKRDAVGGAQAYEGSTVGPGGVRRGALTGHDLSSVRGRRDEADLQRQFAGREAQIDRYQRHAQDSLNTSARAAVDSAMPAFNQELQGLRESHIRRGVNLGDIGTRDEGSLMSAFERNIANAIAGGATDQYNTSLDRLYGEQDRRQAGRNAKAQGRSAIWSGVGKLAGNAFSTFAGGGGN